MLYTFGQGKGPAPPPKKNAFYRLLKLKQKMHTFSIFAHLRKGGGGLQ